MNPFAQTDYTCQDTDYPADQSIDYVAHLLAAIALIQAQHAIYAAIGFFSAAAGYLYGRLSRRASY